MKYNFNTELCFCQGAGVKTPQKTIPCTAGKMAEIINDQYVKNICAALIKLPNDEAHSEQRRQLKERLPVFCFNARSFRDNYRSNENAVPNGRCMLDIDDLDDPRAYYDKLGGDSAMKLCGVGMAHISASGHGLHLVLLMQPHESIEEAQARVARNLGIAEYDRACKDVARPSFAVPEDYILYFAEEAFLADAVVAVEPAAEPAAKPAVEPSMALVPAGQSAEPAIEEAEVIELTDDRTEDLTYGDIPVRDIAARIVLDILGLKAPPGQGVRNNMYVKLQSLLRYCCGNQPELMLQAAPDWGLSPEERLHVCRSVAKYEYKLMPKSLTSLLEKMQQEQGAAQRKPLAARPMPKRLPRLIALILKQFPEEYREQVLAVTLPYLSTLATGLRYQRDPMHVLAANFFVYVLGPLASGKGFIEDLAEIMLPLIFAEDAKVQEIQREWRDSKEANGNGKSPKRPHLIQRCVEPDFTLPALTQQILDSKQQHVLLISPESDTLLITRQVSAQLRKCYDSSKVGQTRVGAASVAGSGKGNMNIVLGGTESAYRSMFRNCEDGLASRFFDVDMPNLPPRHLKWTALTDRERAELNAGLQRLFDIGKIEPVMGEEQQEEDFSPDFWQYTYQPVFIKMPRLEARISEFIDEKAAILAENPDLVAYQDFVKRVPDFIRRCGMMFYAVEGMRETSQGIELALYLGERFLESKLRHVGAEYERVRKEQLAFNQPYHNGCVSQDLLYVLPDQFTTDDLRRERAARNLSIKQSTLSNIITRWKNRGVVRDDGRDESGHPRYAKVYESEACDPAEAI